MTKRCKNCGWPNDDNNVKCQKCNSPLDGGAPVVGGGYSTQRQQDGGGYSTQREGGASSGGENLRKTVSENQFFGTDLSGHQQQPPYPYMNPNEAGTVKNPTMRECPVCHYQLRQGVAVCPNCGSPVSGSPQPQPEPKPQGKPCPKCGKENPSDAKFCSSCGASMEPEAAPKPPTGNTGHHAGTVNPWMQPSTGTFCTLKPISWEGENINHQALSFSGNVISLNRENTDPNNQSITSNVQAELTCEDGEWYIIDKSAMHTTYVMASRKMKLKKGDTIVLGNRLFEFNG